MFVCMPVPNDTTYVNGINNHYRPQTKLREGDVFTAANEVWGKVIFLHLFVILFTGGSASVHAGRPPQEEAPPGGDPTEEAPPLGGDPPEEAPPEEVPPLAQSMLGDTVNVRAVRILLECNVCDSVHRLGGGCIPECNGWGRGVSASGSRGCQPLEPQQP